MPFLEALYREAYAHLRRRAGLRARRVAFRVRYYPYAGLTSTIFKRKDHYEVRLSDVLDGAPLKVHFGLAVILLAKVDPRLEATAAEEAVYSRWARRPEVLARNASVRRERSRRRHGSAQGEVYDLRAMYRALNREYFDALLPEVDLAWSEQESRTRFGYHDEDLGTITLNRRLDDAKVPKRVVAYVLYHEMLHVKHGIGFADDGRRVMHPPAFQRDERAFPAHRSCERFLARLAAGRSRARRSRTVPKRLR